MIFFIEIVNISGRNPGSFQKARGVKWKFGQIPGTKVIHPGYEKNPSITAKTNRVLASFFEKDITC